MRRIPSCFAVIGLIGAVTAFAGASRGAGEGGPSLQDLVGEGDWELADDG